jgi:glutamate racemase
MSPIGIFDSGYGGLTILNSIMDCLPEYDYMYLGDNARAPYGNRSFEAVYQYTLQSVKWLFDKGCPLVILACNTASAKALRNIQQKDLPLIAPDKKVLGIIRPTAEVIGSFSKNGHIGVLGTYGTVQSESYIKEINRFFPDVKVYQQACPLWVPLVENNEINTVATELIVQNDLKKLFKQSADIDTILLACTHYPLLLNVIRRNIPEHINLVSQGNIIAESLKDYLSRHHEVKRQLSKNNKRLFFTTDDSQIFNELANTFFKEQIIATQAFY